MSIENLIGTLQEYLTLKSEISSGNSNKTISNKEVLEAKKRFAKAMNDYVDWRVRGVLASNPTKEMSLKDIALPEASTIPPPPNYSESLMFLHPAVGVINEAPSPLTNIDNESDKIKNWMNGYIRWYNKAKKII